MSFPFENKIKSRIEGSALIHPEDSILIAVSGGADSMGLAHLLFSLKYRVAVAHVNFQLRGAESDGDEALVKGWCMEREIPFHSITFDTQSEALVLKKGIQETARQLRYHWFEQLAMEFGYAKIAVAHHLDDQAETVIFNLMRGSGLQGAKGIPAVQGQIIRPFLSTPKHEILQYVTDHLIPYREDQSNLKTDYTRNKIRHEVLPSMNKINPRASQHVGQFGLRLQTILPGYLAWKKEQLKKYLIPHSWGFTIPYTGSMEEGLWYLLLDDFGFNETQASQLHQAILRKEKGQLFLSPEYQLFHSGASVEIRKLSDLPQPIHVIIEHLPFRVIMEDREFRFDWISDATPDKNLTRLDLSRYTLPLTLRTWRAGDRFAPLGMHGKTKKIQDYLTDLKVSGFEKKLGLVLLSKEEIVWVWPGDRISEHVKSVDNNPSTLSINILENPV